MWKHLVEPSFKKAHARIIDYRKTTQRIELTLIPGATTSFGKSFKTIESMKNSCRILKFSYPVLHASTVSDTKLHIQDLLITNFANHPSPNFFFRRHPFRQEEAVIMHPTTNSHIIYAGLKLQQNVVRQSGAYE